MWKTNQPNTAKSFGMGKISPVHVALIVYQYLNDNNFSQTRSTFRNEASSLFSDSLINEASKSWMSLGQILDDYMCLKVQKVMLDEQQVEVTQEKNQIHMLWQGI
ncbi:hypothetical protein JHK87_001302 [Glycine soja]|nr:hypothetical protein JHK87_001302 [Glycine soja]